MSKFPTTYYFHELCAHFLQIFQHLHHRIISLRREIWAHRTSLTPPLFDWSARKVNGHVFVCYGYLICVFLRFWYLILELFRQCGIFCIPFCYRITFMTLSPCPTFQTFLTLDDNYLKLIQINVNVFFTRTTHRSEDWLNNSNEAYKINKTNMKKYIAEWIKT